MLDSNDNYIKASLLATNNEMSKHILTNFFLHPVNGGMATAEAETKKTSATLKPVTWSSSTCEIAGTR